MSCRRGHRTHVAAQPGPPCRREARHGLHPRTVLLPRHRHRTPLGRRGFTAHHVGTVPADRLAVGAGDDGLHHLRQRRHAVRHHGLRQGARRAGTHGRRRPRRCHLSRAADAPWPTGSAPPSTTSSTTETSRSPGQRSTSRQAGSRRARWRHWDSATPPSSVADRHSRLSTSRVSVTTRRRIGGRPRVEGDRRGQALNGSRLEDRHPRRGRNRSGLSWHRDARHPRDRRGVRGGAGNSYVP
jgi:hypothetical protein